ncbi:hypothetical protein [Marinicrinis sediminis]|uniref:Uncharacterized protein n=1 Tax=Marinicrinis sediminis TaxID=1652465 RepID=A0ABW5RB10_9BACL
MAILPTGTPISPEVMLGTLEVARGSSFRNKVAAVLAVMPLAGDTLKAQLNKYLPAVLTRNSPVAGLAVMSLAAVAFGLIAVYV